MVCELPLVVGGLAGGVEVSYDVEVMAPKRLFAETLLTALWNHLFHLWSSRGVEGQVRHHSVQSDHSAVEARGCRWGLPLTVRFPAFVTPQLQLTSLLWCRVMRVRKRHWLPVCMLMIVARRSDPPTCSDSGGGTRPLMTSVFNMMFLGTSELHCYVLMVTRCLSREKTSMGGGGAVYFL